ncbi:MAG: hypothetical protein UX80_C0003G0078 [Candidatus Amesbacteria bacterium GW2011_GWA2_47_11b]|uniref:Uncharacterized protein n=1 Tax=Candidatus Amesbacteria bacterium GW2011_GWA2_47_11b TaxID=1618358 RepID=A0A0G1TWA4_9BACT|nr:MAG: hypothetical protein UX80_C0003G0078 [Candidatus Amesbacteria bacterium GW2011_GWA2_47_11b]
MGGYTYEEGSLFIRQAIDRGVSFRIERGMMGEMLGSMGLKGNDPWRYIDERMVGQAKVWSLREEKRRWEMKIVRPLRPLLRLASVGALGYGILYGVDPILKYKVGFLGAKEDYEILKLRTLKNDVGGKVNPLFTTAFSGWVGGGIMSPLGWVAAKARSTSADEIFEVGQIIAGDMQLVGLRAWGNDPVHKSNELRGLKILHDHKDDPEFSQLGDVAPFLSVYQRIIGLFAPLPALANPLTAFKSKESGIYRVVSDLVYACQACEEMDGTILDRTLRKRVFTTKEKEGAR